MGGDLRPENKTLVVVLSALQLSAVVLVWLLAIVPAGLLALTAIAGKAAVATFASFSRRSPPS